MVAIDCGNLNRLALVGGLQHVVDRVDFITTNNLHSGTETHDYGGAKSDTHDSYRGDYSSADHTGNDHSSCQYYNCRRPTENSACRGCGTYRLSYVS